ncbi:hypothetical protein U0070_011796 [Myodes glareolus]|uniref:Uncharacterized protein n=1 Tax=Myodes glareolus TaxID=447135 RepID=A0AAW0I2F0_MYOGA
MSRRPAECIEQLPHKTFPPPFGILECEAKHIKEELAHPYIFCPLVDFLSREHIEKACLKTKAELEPGRGGVRGAGPGRELLRVRPERTRGASARRLAGTLRRRRRCGGRGEVHERSEGGAESGCCPVRRLLESPGGGERRARQARGGGPSGAGEQPGACSFVCSLARALRGCSRAGRLQQVGSVAGTPWRRRWPGSSSEVCAFFLILEKNAGPEARYPESIASVGRISIETKPD